MKIPRTEGIEADLASMDFRSPILDDPSAAEYVWMSGYGWAVPPIGM